MLKIIKYFTIGVALITLLGLIGGAFGLFTKVVSTPSRVLSKTLDTNNVIQSYEWFYDVDAAYKARYSQVKQYKSMLEEEENREEKYQLRTELSAMQQSCRDLATKYNANSNKMNKSIFKGWSLPKTLSYINC